MDWNSPYIQKLIAAALEEEVGSGDASVAATISSSACAVAHIVTEQELVCASLPLVEPILRSLDPDICVSLRAAEGQKVAQGTSLAEVNGSASAILTGRQTVLNFLAHLCGVATLTREYVDRISGTSARIRDSRNSNPGLRQLEQYALQIAGGVPHQAGLFDAMVLDVAHIAGAGGIQAALDQAHAYVSSLMNPSPMTAYEATGTIPSGSDSISLCIQIQVRDEIGLREALSAGAESILLEGLDADEVRRRVDVTRGIRRDCVVEVTGEITLDVVRAYAESGVDYISPVALTGSAPAAAIRLLVDSFQ
jgi:nicotinate-nucleotide pyrophosphorylase (carboxylating)